MGNTWVTNILHYLDEDRQFAVKSGPARRIAEYQCSIVEAVTSRPVDADWMTDIRCRRRPGHKPCIGPIIAGYDEDDSTTIVWGCPVCGDEGYISGWQETMWDKPNVLIRSGSLSQIAARSPRHVQPNNSSLSATAESVRLY